MGIAINNLAPAAEDRASGAMVINQSLRFRHGGQLTRNLQTGFGSFSATGTLSMWIKIINRLSDSTASHIWRADNVGTSGGDRALNLERGSAIKVTATGNTSPTASTALLRDVNAWYHLMIIADSSSVELYANGNLIFTNSSGWSSGTNSFSDNMRFENLNESHNTINFYLAEVHYLDGTKATVGTDFGFTDPLTNTWRPKKYTGTHGTNGFYLDFRDPDNLGADRSGNNLNFTASNFIADDVMKESPSGVAYGSVPTSGITTTNTAPSNYCTMNQLDAGNDSGIGEVGLKVGITTAANTTSIRGTMSVSSGKWYFEVQKITAGTINIQCGWAAVSLAHKFTTSDTGVYNKAISGTTVMIAADFDRNAIWTGVDGTWDNSATVAEIESGDTSNATHTSVSNYPLAPMFLDQASSFSGEARFNFGQRDFTHTPPSGYKTLCAANLPRPTKLALNPNKYVGIVTYSGTGSAQSIPGLEFQPDFVWIKKRDNEIESHRLTDVVRGTTKTLLSDFTGAEATSSDRLTAFNSDGFSLGDDVSVNQDGRGYVAWCWKANGPRVTNNDGNTTSRISANQEAGFSIIDYDGAGSGTTIGHGLGKKPEFILFKALGTPDSTAQNWNVYHHSITADNVLFLNLANQQSDDAGFMNDTEPDSSIITLGGSFSVSHTGSDYIAYAWTSIEGFSKFGSYTANNDADGPFIELGFKPQFLIIKSATSVTNWHIYDSERDPVNRENKFVIHPNSNAQEKDDADERLDILSNGFKLRSVDNDNVGSNTYIYAAWSEAPTFNLYGAQANAR